MPTIALIDETRRRLARFRATYKIITHPSEPLGARNIIVMTQERFLEMETLPTIDFFMIDEFYKLGSGRPKDSRRTLLNLAWQKLKATGAQYYLIGPNVDSLDVRVPEELQESLIRSDFRPVAVDVIDRSDIDDQRSDLLRLLGGEIDGSTLVFTGSPEKAEALAVDIASVISTSQNGMAGQVADWLAANYDPDWSITQALRGGVAVHTGPLPRGLQRIMVRLFNESMVGQLVCTSTLIEGVNTSARNVVIYEKKIDGQLIDFFTFNNIRGRAGRMFRHFVGRVITYMPSPADEATVVDIPIETQSSLAREADLIQIDAAELDQESRERLANVLEQKSLSLETIRKNRGLDPALQVAAAEKLLSMSMSARATLAWTGAPTLSESKDTLRFAWDHLLESHYKRGMNFDMLWGKLQNARHHPGDLSAQVNQQMRYARDNQTRSDIVTDVLRFQRNWMGYTIPSMLRGLQNIQGELSERGGDHANYEFLVREIESLYMPFGINELEDYGLPTPLGLKLATWGLQGEDIPSLLDSVEVLSQRPEVVGALSHVEQWILEDVVRGLRGK